MFILFKLYDETLKFGDEQQSNLKHTVGVQLVN